MCTFLSLYGVLANCLPFHKAIYAPNAHTKSEMNRVVIVDDEEAILKLYAAIVKRVLGEEAVAFENPLDALERLATLRPSIVIVDHQMPEMDGVSFVRALRNNPLHEFTPVIMLTANGDPSLGQRAMEAGATLFLEKPLSLRDFTAHLRHFAGGAAARTTYGEIVMPTDERDTLLRLHRALQAHNAALAEHCVRARDVALEIAHEMRLASDDIESLRIGGLVYDIGMLAVPDKVRDLPSTLPARWRSIVNGHVDAGAMILGEGHRPLLKAAEAMARYHHERFDGTGYPEGLAGDEIPLGARILAVADTYVALVSERPHRVEFTEHNAAAQIAGLSGSAFDPMVVDAFLRARGHHTKRSA